MSVLAPPMFGSKVPRAWKAPLMVEVQARLPLFDDLPSGTIRHLTAAGFGRGFLTATLRARLRKAGIRDFGHLAQSSPDAIVGIRKFGPARAALVRALLLEEIARLLPGERDLHASEATETRRLARLRAMPVERLSLPDAVVSALGLVGASCAEAAGRSRADINGPGLLWVSEVDRLVATLAGLLGADTPILRPMIEIEAEAGATEAERRAAQLADRDREWDAAAPAAPGRRKR